MFKLVTAVALFLLLSSCVIYMPKKSVYSTVVYVNNTSSSVSTVEKKITNGVSERVVENGQTSSQRSLAECPEFVLPRDTAKPKPLTKSDLEGPRSLQALDQLIMAKLAEYRTHTDIIHSKIEQAHREWLESCQQILLD